MDSLQIISLLIVLAALFSFINYKLIRLPTTIGVMVIALLFSVALLAVDTLGFHLKDRAKEMLGCVPFGKALLHGMLGFLLFAGALHVNLEDLWRQKWVITILSSVGVVASTFIVGSAMYWLLGLLGFEISYLYCLAFGALISPTDPIAVLGILKTTCAPKTLETKIAGESLFNDGIGVVVFLVLLELLDGQQEPSFGGAAKLFLVEAVGGGVFGLLIGYVAFRMLAVVDNYQVEVLLTLALVMGGYTLANALHMSGPIAIVVAGLLVGNHGRALAMSDTTREHLDTFWELVDEILNALLFLLIGLEVLILPSMLSFLVPGLIAIAVVLSARLISVFCAVSALRFRRSFTRGAVWIMTWGGLRGGISVALALSLPGGAQRDVILSITYIIVVFSIVIQGVTVGPLIRRILHAPDGSPEAAAEAVHRA